MRTFFTIGLLYVSAAFLSFGQAAKQPPRPNSRPPSLNEVLSWLPVDTETVLAANGPFPFPDFDSLSGDEPEDQPLPLAELNLRMRGLPLGGFASDNDRLRKALKGSRVLLALEGSRRFRSPTGSGSTLFQGCAIAVLEGAPIDRDSLVRDVAGSSERIETVEGVKVAVFQEQKESDTWTFLVAFPRSSIVLVATDRSYLREVLARMRAPGTARALPESLPEWKHVNTRAPFWGLRHFQRNDAAEDPTSPFLGDKAANVPDDDAVGATFWFDPVNRKRV
ncbi:MAG TPA: hypothetical protein VGP79_03170, partial [Bryobacteraceae bacterium]|nr:hypothetical protein [Bryobacteraceae bacterium]